MKYIEAGKLQTKYEICMEIKKGEEMKEKLNTFFALMIHFLGVLSVGFGLGICVGERKVTWGTWFDLVIGIAFICLYVYLSFKNNDASNKK
jgi:hypothetical protein